MSGGAYPVWPPPAGPDSRWHALRFTLDGLRDTWVLREVRLWGRDVLASEDGRVFCWSCVDLLELPRAAWEVQEWLRVHRFAQLEPANAGIGLEPRPGSGEQPLDPAAVLAELASAGVVPMGPTSAAPVAERRYPPVGPSGSTS